MKVHKHTEPLYLKSGRSLQKVGYQVVRTITNKAGEVLRHDIVKQKIYK